MIATFSNSTMNMEEQVVEALIVKGVDRIEAINTPLDERVEANFRAWQICRVFRRDFNKFTAKMFVTCRNPSNLHKIRPMLLDIKEEAEILSNMARRFEMPKDLPFTTIPLRIVSEEARLLYEAIITVDWAVAKMIHSGEMDEMNKMNEKAMDDCAHFFKAYNRLKRFIFYRPKHVIERKTFN